MGSWRQAPEDDPLGQSHERLRRLQRLTAALCRAVTAEDVAECVTAAALTELGAAGAILCRLDGDTFRVVRHTGFPPSMVQAWDASDLSALLPAGDAVRLGAPVVLQSVAERDERYPALQGLDALHRAWAVAPLVVEDGAALGVLLLGGGAEHVFTVEELAFVEAAAAVTASALERARLHDRARDAAARERVLAEQLQRALESRVVIEQAKGILAERFGVGVDHAFQLLREHARRTNRRLHVIAEGVVDGAEQVPASTD